MASINNPNNYFLKPDVLTTVASNTGELGQQKRGAVNKNAHQDTFRSHLDHTQALEQHGAELAHLTGATHEAHDDKNQNKIEDRQKRERQHELEKEDTHEPQGHTVVSPKGKTQTLGDEEHERLQKLDSSLYTGLELNRDIKPEQLAAAQRMVESQPPKKNAQLKQVPEAEEAMHLILLAAPSLTKPLDICAPGSDKQPLIQVEPSENEVSVAQGYAAQMLASGAIDEQMMVG